MSKQTPTSEQVIEQLTRLLSTEVFQNSNILPQFLKFVVDETLAGHEKDLKEYIIGVKALSKKASFNPQADPVVRIQAGRLRRALHEYYNEKGKSDPVIISIPKGAYVPEFTIRGGDDKSVLNGTDPEMIIRNKIIVAVLPFRNNSAATASVFFADSLGDDISTELARYPELSVISYYSCRNIADKVTDVKEAGALLDAKYILTGTVQSDDNRLRVRAQLILSETREQLWANSYERQNTATDLFGIQDEIVHKVVSQVAGHYGVIFRNVSRMPLHKHAEDLKIYDAIFWYYHNANETKEDVFIKAMTAMLYAVEADPEYALGWAVLGEIYISGYFMQYKSGIENALEEAINCGRRSIKIDPTCQHAYLTIALANNFLHNRQECIKIIDQWMKQDYKAAGIMGGIGTSLIFAGEYERGIKLLDDSIHLNPYYQWWYNGGLAFYHLHKKEYEDAIYWAEKMNMPHIPWELVIKTASLAEMNNMDEARQCAARLQQQFPFIENILRPFLSAFLYDETLIDQLYNGLLKAGI